jgi:hypothetical protein
MSFFLVNKKNIDGGKGSVDGHPPVVGPFLSRNDASEYLNQHGMRDHFVCARTDLDNFTKGAEQC